MVSLQYLSSFSTIKYYRTAAILCPSSVLPCSAGLVSGSHHEPSTGCCPVWRQARNIASDHMTPPLHQIIEPSDVYPTRVIRNSPVTPPAHWLKPVLARALRERFFACPPPAIPFSLSLTPSLFLSNSRHADLLITQALTLLFDILYMRV